MDSRTKTIAPTEKEAFMPFSLLRLRPLARRAHSSTGNVPGERTARRLSLTVAIAIVMGAAVSAGQNPPHKVTLIEGGTTREITTTAETVSQFLAENKLILGKLDRSSVTPAAPLTDGMQIVITRIRTEQNVERKPIAFPTTEKFVRTLRVGEKKIVQAGKKGEKTATYLSTYKDGERVQHKQVAVKVTPPRRQIVLKGMRGMTLASRGWFGGRRVLEMVATGYGPGGGMYPGSRTRTGLKQGKGVVAVDPRFIPLGTRLYIDGYGYAVAGDTGGAIKGARIDLGFNTDREAMAVGRRKVRVLILN